MDRVDLHAVHPGLLAPQSGLAEGVDKLPDHVLGKMVHQHLRVPDVGFVRVRGGPPPFGHDEGRREGFQKALLHKGLQQRRQEHGPAGARADLEEDLCAAVVDLPHDGLDRLEDLGVLVDPLLPDNADERDQAGDEQADVLVLPVPVELPDPLDKARLCLPLDHVGALHGQHDDAVLDLDVPDLPGPEQRFVLRIHKQPSCSILDCYDTVIRYGIIVLYRICRKMQERPQICLPAFLARIRRRRIDDLNEHKNDPKTGPACRRPVV